MKSLPETMMADFPDSFDFSTDSSGNVVMKVPCGNSGFHNFWFYYGLGSGIYEGMVSYDGIGSLVSKVHRRSMMSSLLI
jgi:hypothetical protein